MRGKIAFVLILILFIVGCGEEPVSEKLLLPVDDIEEEVTEEEVVEEPVEEEEEIIEEEPEEEIIEEVEEEEPPEPGAEIEVIKFLGDLEDHIFNSMVFEITNTGERDLIDPVVSIEVFYNHPAIYSLESVYTYEHRFNGRIKKGESSSYKIPIDYMETGIGRIKNAVSKYDIIVELSEKGVLLGESKEFIEVDKENELVEKSFSSSFKIESPDYSSSVIINNIGVVDKGDVINSITLTLDNQDELEKPVVDFFYGEEYSIILDDIGTANVTEKELPLSLKVEPGARMEDVYIQVRDGEGTEVYASLEAEYYMDCDRENNQFEDCEIFEQG